MNSGYDVSSIVSAVGAVTAAIIATRNGRRLNDTKHAVGVVTDKVDSHDAILKRMDPASPAGE